MAPTETREHAQVALRSPWKLSRRRDRVSKRRGLAEEPHNSPAVIERHIEIDDVAVFQWSCIGNAVANDLVHRSVERQTVSSSRSMGIRKAPSNSRAHAPREEVVVEGARVRLALHALLVYNSVNLKGRHAGLDHGGSNVEHFSAVLWEDGTRKRLSSAPTAA